MREFKFRAWVISKATNTSWMNYDIEFVGGRINDNFAGKHNSLADITYMQYTGLKDKNGQEIYEGDIVIHNDYSGGLVLGGEQYKRKSVIKWNEQYTGYRLKGMGTSINSDKCEIIGNIYENPELVRVKS
ncbi:YopX family protein [Oceanobacillus sp. J11TS1]|uniref:YopX family protein n=1 Tax=Oceanobacillus sp. J11TS1 TaxID=2807191 RepID=UPI001B1158F9|nr:YopX family protein [Oceanobacillus sp. J11TS1]GIO25374.1 hypothetical protein J11TS1_39550 [Oceanobacillus sp. J11TS1]